MSIQKIAVGKSAGGNHYGSERQERDQEKANRLVDEELRRLVWTEKELGQRPEGDKPKVETARMLRQKTTMTLKWIAQRLHMGSWTYAPYLLHQNQHPNVNSEDLLLRQIQHLYQIELGLCAVNAAPNLHLLCANSGSF